LPAILWEAYPQGWRQASLVPVSVEILIKYSYSVSLLIKTPDTPKGILGQHIIIKIHSDLIFIAHSYLTTVLAQKKNALLFKSKMTSSSGMSWVKPHQGLSDSRTGEST